MSELETRLPVLMGKLKPRKVEEGARVVQLVCGPAGPQSQASRLCQSVHVVSCGCHWWRVDAKRNQAVLAEGAAGCHVKSPSFSVI